ncbi:MAG: glycosyltransferase family 2 protein [Flavobacteriales bacterium]
MPAYKMGAYIREALDSVAAQSHSDWEVIVVDDHAPEDGTTAIIQAFAAAHPQRRVHLVRHAHNQGVSAARNTGIQAANGGYVAFLDPDDAWYPDHLRNALAQLEGGDPVDVVCAPVESFRDEPGRSWTHQAYFEGWKTKHFPLSLAVYNFILPTAVVARRARVLEVGCFDTEPALQHIEDYDLWIRLVEAGARFRFLSTIGARYRKHAGGATAHEEKFKVLHERLYQKHPAFFREGQRRMLRVALDDQARQEGRDQGPLIRAIRWIDDILRRLSNKFGRS